MTVELQQIQDIATKSSHSDYSIELIRSRTSISIQFATFNHGIAQGNTLISIPAVSLAIKKVTTMSIVTNQTTLINPSRKIPNLRLLHQSPTISELQSDLDVDQSIGSLSSI